MRPIAVQFSCCRTWGISLDPFHDPQESKRSRISYCRPNISTRNEAQRPPPSAHHSWNRNRSTLVEAILLTGLCSARNSFGDELGSSYEMQRCPESYSHGGGVSRLLARLQTGTRDGRTRSRNDRCKRLGRRWCRRVVHRQSAGRSSKHAMVTSAKAWSILLASSLA